MTTMSHLPPNQAIEWEEIGAWQAGTVVGVALQKSGHGRGRGLLASRTGVYGWQQPGAALEPLIAGMSDLHVVAVAFAGGDAESPAKALAATATGRLFRLQENREWQEISSWAGLGVAVVLVPSPAYAQDHTLFAGTPTGIFRTQDEGKSWESCNFGLLDEDALCMACAPDFGESELLWAGTAGGGLYRSRNSGRAWRESGYGLPDAAVQALAISPNFSQDRTLFVGMEAHGVYVSRDGGENWVSLGLPGQSVNSLACPRADLLWAGTEDGLWRMAAGSGEAVQVGAAGEVVLSVAASAGGQVAAGLFGGGLWLVEEEGTGSQPLVGHTPALAVHAPPVIAASGADLFALDSDGLMARSHDGGAQWSAMESATAESIFALGAGLDGEGSPSLFAATDMGLSRWDPAQALWQEVASEVFPDQTALALALSPTFGSDQTLLVVAPGGALQLSQDGGATWRSITGPWRGQSLLRAQFAPDTPREVIALTVQPTDVGHFDVTAWHTIDLGESWEVLANFSSGVPAVMTAWPEDAQEHALFLATQHRVVKLYNQIEPPELQVHQHFFDERLSVTVLAPAPDYAESHSIWAATTGGLYRSVDCGMSWGLMAELPLGLPLIWLEVSATHLHAITLGGRVWRATL
ncbi:MAG: hypothetical protein IT328_03550 [Caldilineaceae bacterium]|nr:hypothetical protein [Caldilineaceae bacterium]